MMRWLPSRDSVIIYYSLGENTELLIFVDTIPAWLVWQSRLPNSLMGCGNAFDSVGVKCQNETSQPASTLTGSLFSLPN